jgi:hypothetical protein
MRRCPWRRPGLTEVLFSSTALGVGIADPMAGATSLGGGPNIAVMVAITDTETGAVATLTNTIRRRTPATDITGAP